LFTNPSFTKTLNLLVMNCGFTLQAMRYAGQRAPAPLRVGDLPDGGSYLVMEYLDFKPFALLDPSAQRLLGRSIAQMHMHQPDRHAFFGFGLDTKVR
jgi:fructosamine-3-kinase